jgi:hypothetical protein
LIQGLVIAGFLVVVGALARNYVSTINDKQLAEERSKETITMLPRPISYLVAFRGSAEMGRFYDRIDLPMKHEHVMFVGLIPWVCVIIVLLVARRAVLNPATVSAVVAMFLIIGLTLYVGGFSLYFILMKIPGVVGIRGVTRFILILLFPFALATAQVIHLCTERLQYFKPAMAIFAVLLAAALFMENQVTPYRYSKKESQERVRKLLEQIPPEKQKSVLAYLYPLEGEERHYYYEIDAMLAAQDRNGATMNGYSAAVPLGFRFLRSCMDVKLALDDIPRLGPSFKLPSGIPDVVTVGQPADGPCTAYLGREATAATELPDAAFRAGIVVNAPQDIGVGSSFTARVNVTNQSPVLWRVKGLPDGKLAMRVSCQWKTPGAVSRDEYPNRFEMPYDLQPNETASIAVSLKAPETSGEYELECDAIQELIHWFHHMGSKTGTTLVQIRRDPSTPAIRSNLDAANSTVIAGWAMDQDHPKTPLEIEILDGDKVIATVKADRFRQDLLNAGLGDGTYAFSIPAPAELRDGKPHTVHARVKGTNAGLTGSPKAYAP